MFRPLSLITGLVNPLEDGTGGVDPWGSDWRKLSSCRGVHAETLHTQKKHNPEVRLLGEEVKGVEEVTQLSKSQIERVLKIYTLCFVLYSGAPLVGVISAAAFLLK